MKQMKTSARWLILIISAVMIIAGISMNEYKEVLSKAVMICMECIGIG